MYTVHDQLRQVTKGNHTTQFSYSPEGQRYKRVDRQGSEVTTTLYLGNVEKIYYPDSSVEQGSTKTIYHAGNVELIKEGEAVTIRRNIGNALVELTGQSSKTRYVYTDHLGSMDVITDVSGRVEQRFGFDAFGKRRIVTGPGHQVTTLNLSAILALTHRGFTGHQQVDHANIIHMGGCGRIYNKNAGAILNVAGDGL